MKKYIILSLLALGLINIKAQSDNSGEQKGLDDIIVKETFEAGSEEEKLPVSLKADFSNLVEIKERIYWSSVSWEFGGEQPTVQNFSGKFSQPELTGIAPAPAKVFFMNFEELASWKIDVFTSDGKKFRTLSGEGKPPKSIGWDGRGDDNNPLTPGESYAYSLTAIDKAGNRRTFPGGAFSVPALYLNDEDGIWIGLSYSSLFTPNGYGLAPEAENFAAELVNFIYYFSNDGSVRIDSDHPLTDTFVSLLAKKLSKETDFFEIISSAESNGKCFIMKIN
jgi:hypothetical protein